jgi:phenylpyruvate tautomerase PptA (4-oxalocrotonate tautomerase family)
MPMIDIYASEGTFSDTRKLAQQAATIVMEVEKVPPIAMFSENTAAFVHALPAAAISNANGDGNYVRVQVLTNSAALDREKQITLVERLTELVATSAGDPELKQRTWVLLTEAIPGGWGLWGHAHTNEEIIAAARAEIASSTAQ